MSSSHSSHQAPLNSSSPENYHIRNVLRLVYPHHFSVKKHFCCYQFFLPSSTLLSIFSIRRLALTTRSTLPSSASQVLEGIHPPASLFSGVYRIPHPIFLLFVIPITSVFSKMILSPLLLHYSSSAVINSCNFWLVSALSTMSSAYLM